MNTTNPFQIPSCLQRADLQQRRRERFRRGVVLVVAAFVVLLVVLLIEGCVSEHARSSTGAPAVATQPKALPSQVAVVKPKQPVLTAPSKPAVAPAAAPAKLVMPAVSQPELIYVVKPGDTLTRIARIHRTTVKSLKAINGLDHDNIAIGAKLKLPPA